MKKIIFSVLFVLSLTACQLEQAVDNSSLTKLNLSLVSSRTILPKASSITYYSIKVGASSPIPFSELNKSFYVNKGYYNIVVNGYDKDNKLLAQFSVDNYEIKTGLNTLEVKLEYLQESTGDITITLNWSKDGVAKVTGSLIDLSSSSTPINITGDITFDELNKTLTLDKNISSKDYLVVIKLTNSSDKVLFPYSEIVQVYDNQVSSKTMIIPDSNFNSAPTAPDSLEVLEYQNGYKLKWVDTTYLEEYFRVERSKKKLDGSWDDWIIIKEELFANSINYVDFTADSSIKNRYRVIALNSFGEASSDPVETTDTTAPIPGALFIKSKTEDSVTLNWSKATDPLPEEVSYLVYYSDNYSTATEIVNKGIQFGSAQNNISSKKVTGLLDNRKYYFVVVSEDKSGNSSFYNVVDTLISSDITPPEVVSLRASEWTPNNTARIYWNAVSTNERVTYKLYYSDKFSTHKNVVAKGTLAFTDYSDGVKSFDKTIRNLSKGTYYFTVVAEDESGNKSYSSYQDPINWKFKNSPIPSLVKGVLLDNERPTTGTITDIATNYITLPDNSINIYTDLKWTPATDNGTSQDDLRYKVYFSKDHSLKDDIKEYGYLSGNMFEGRIVDGKISKRVDNLLYNTRYYFTIEVFDNNNNSILYEPVSIKSAMPDDLPLIRIKKVTPGEGAIHVDLDQEVTIYFYEELEAGSINNLRVFADEVDSNGDIIPGTRVNGAVTYDNVKRAIIFTPEKNIPLYDKDNNVIRNTRFKEASSYQVTIENISSLGGEVISWDFKFKTLDYSIFTSHWKLDNNGLDSSGKNRDINNINADFKSGDKKEGSHSVYLNGSQNASINDLKLGNAFTVTAWVNMDSPMQDSLNTIIANTVSSEASNGFKLCVNKWFDTTKPEGPGNYKSDKRIVIEVGNGEYGGKFITGENFVAPGGWYHLAFIIDQPNKTMKIYFNGVEAELTYISEDDGTKTPTKKIFDDNAWDFKTDGKFFFGSFYDSTDYGFKGHIDDMRAYNTVLTDKEVKQIATQNY